MNLLQETLKTLVRGVSLTMALVFHPHLFLLIPDRWRRRPEIIVWLRPVSRPNFTKLFKLVWMQSRACEFFRSFLAGDNAL